MPTCEDCGFEAQNERGLSIHQSRSHSDGGEKKTYECAHCGETFEDYPSRRETRGRETFYCSRECKDKGQEKETFVFDCAWCGDAVERHPSTVDQMGDYELRNHFCDKECESAYKSEHWVGEDHPNWTEDNTVEKTCAECGAEIEVREYYDGRLQHHFCDKECHDAFQTGQAFADCHLCGDEFELTPMERISQQERYFCSEECSSEWRSQWQSGENNPAWRGGKERYYGPDWSETRQEILQRDDFECQECGCTQRDHYDLYGRDLHVHHIERLTSFDGDYETANQWDNLVALCHRCHARADFGSLSLA